MKTEFIAKLEDIELDKEAQKRIALGLQNLVVNELALMDNKGDLVIQRQLKLGPTNGIMAIEKAGVINISGLR